VARGLLVVIQALATAALFALVRRAGSPGAAHAAAATVAAAPVFLFPQLSNYYYTTLAFYGALGVVYLGARALDSRTWAAVAGAGVAAIALFKQTTGVAFAVAFVPAVVALAPRATRSATAGAVLGGGALITALTLGVYALRGDLASLVYGMVELPLSMGPTFRAPTLNVWPPGELDPVVRENWVMYLPSLYYLQHGLFAVLGRGIIAFTQLLYALPFLALIATAVLAVWRGLTAATWLHGAVLFAMTANLFPRASWGHLVVALPPAVVQAWLLTSRKDASSDGRLTRVAGLFSIGIALAAIATATWLGSLAGPKTFGPRVPLAPVSLSYRQPSIPRVIRYLLGHTRPGEAIFVTRQEPLLYFATRTRNPTPFGGVLPGLPELQEPVILSALEDVRYVVMSDIDQPLYTYYADELPRVQAHLERHYRIPEDFPLDDYSWIVVARRGPDRGPTAFDLVDRRAEARRYVLGADGQRRAPGIVPQRLAARQLHRPLPVALGSGGGGIDFDLVLPQDAVFQAGVGYRGLVSIDHHYLHPPGVTLAVEIRREGSDGFEELASIRINDNLRAGRRWVPFEVDLSRFGGERVTLRLAARAKDLAEPDMLTWWGSPRIATPALDPTARAGTGGGTS
jgi:hypothetical protein